MVPVPLSGLKPSREEAIEEWPWLDEAVLRSSRSRQVCMTCHFFRHHPGPNCIPQLACHLHQGLIAHGDHLTHRCSGWTEDLHRQRELPDDMEFPRMARATLRFLQRQVNHAVARGEEALLEGLGEAEQGVGVDQEEAS